MSYPYQPPPPQPPQPGWQGPPPMQPGWPPHQAVQPGLPAPPPPRKSRTGLIVGLIVGGVVLIMLCVCGGLLFGVYQMNQDFERVDDEVTKTTSDSQLEDNLESDLKRYAEGLADNEYEVGDVTCFPTVPPLPKGKYKSFTCGYEVTNLSRGPGSAHVEMVVYVNDAGEWNIGDVRVV